MTMICWSVLKKRPITSHNNLGDSFAKDAHRAWPGKGALLAVVLGALGSVMTKQAAPQARNNPTPQFLASSTPSDAAAQAELRKVVNACGGFQLWNEFGTAQLRFQSAATPGTKQQPDRLMLDDWSSDKVRYRRGYIGMPNRPITHDGRSSLSIVSDKDTKKAISIPEFDQARVLASHLPAAAALVILRNSSYIVKSTHECTSGKLCFSVYRKAAPQSPFQLEQKWTIDESSYLPITIQTLLPTISKNPSGVWKMITFLEFTSEQGVKVPQQLSTGMNGIQGSLQTLVSASFSTGFNTDEFDREVRK